MKNILTIFKKEWDRVIRDKRLVIMVMIFPGLMIFMIYSFIGNAIQNTTENTDFQVAIVNPQADFEAIYTAGLNNDNFEAVPVLLSREDYYEQKINEGDWDLLIIFDADFADYNSVGDKPNVYLYYNPNVTSSAQSYSYFSSFLNQYQSTLSYELYSDTRYFILNQGGTELDTNRQNGMIYASLMPMLIVMFLFSGAMSIGPESIAGEKERGTIATLLVTPVRRRDIAIGKIMALSVLTLISATSSFIGISASLPILLGLSGSAATAIYSVSDYLMILLVLFSTVLVIVGIISIISAYSRSLKEAQSMIIPIYILTILVSISSMFTEGAASNYAMYLLPIYNSVQSLNAIFTFDANSLIYILITVLSNLVYLTFFVYILNKMFNSEKMMFKK